MNEHVEDPRPERRRNAAPVARDHHHDRSAGTLDADPDPKPCVGHRRIKRPLARAATV